MRAAEALKMARAAGIKLGIDGDDLVLEASAPPRAAVLDLLSRHKAGIVMLRSGGDGWSAEAWQGFFDKRIGISEFDGAQPRSEAEARAFCAVEWRLTCGKPSRPRCEDSHDPAAFRNGKFRVWPHSRCQPAWYVARKAEAVAALAAMGIMAPIEFPDDFGKNGGA